MCVCACVHVSVCVCVDKPVAVELRCHATALISQFELSHFWAQLLLKLMVPCERNSSYNFIPILLKFYRCFCQGLKMCMTFGYNPQINF